jgi:uncharacterized membrane protein
VSLGRFQLGMIGRMGRQRDERGAMLILAAAGLVLAMIFAALAIDIGFLAADKRTDQKFADLAALDASRDLTNIQALAEASVARNFNGQRDAFPTTLAQLVRKDTVTGDYVPDITGKFVRVTVTSPRKPFFPFVSGSTRTVKAVAVAGGQPFAQFSVGSSLASLDTRKSALDGLIGPMLGGVNMSAVSYSGLASGGVDLRLIQTKLLAMGYDVGTTDKLFNTNLDVADLLTATGQALTADGDFVAAAEINDIPINLIPNLQTVTIGDLVNLSQPGTDSALDTEINAFQLVSAAAQVANGTNFVAVPGINCGGLLAALLSCSISLHVVEPAQTSILGPVGVTAKTAQVVLKVRLNLAAILGINLLTADLNFSAGNGSGILTNIDCDATPGITVNASTSAATINGNVGGTGLLGLPLLGSLTVNGSIAPTTATDATFAYPNQFLPPIGPSPAYAQHVGVASVGLAPLSPPGLTLGGSGALGLLAGVVDPILENVLGALDGLLVPTLGPILDVLGLDLAGADVMAVQIDKPPPACGTTRLVK